MKQELRFVSMKLPIELLERIDDYWHRRRFMTRTETIRTLLELALKREAAKLAAARERSSFAA